MIINQGGICLVLSQLLPIATLDYLQLNVRVWGVFDIYGLFSLPTTCLAGFSRLVVMDRYFNVALIFGTSDFV